MSFEFINGSVVELVVPTNPPVLLPPVETSETAVILAQGPPGPQGIAGYTDGYPQWFNGEGPPPDAIVGSQPGDMYVDVSPGGQVYQLRWE